MASQIVDDDKFIGDRLPTNIKPIHYDLCLVPNFNNFTFNGEVEIQYETSSSSSSSSSGGGGGVADPPTNIIVLHAYELEIAEGSLENNPLISVTYSKTSETATLEFREPIRAKGRIKLKFTGILNDYMKGFYRTAFKIGNTTVYAATTQFEATYARRCFPCWDEPAIRATFSTTLVIDQFMIVNGEQYERLALSNMPEISRSQRTTATTTTTTTTGSPQVEVKFDKTPSMSTYLLAFIVGPFEMIQDTDKGRPIRVYTTPGKKEQGRYALNVACKSLHFFEDYFKVDYPLPKMDLIAVPDFAIGAMENWGLITYRERCLLVDNENTATGVKQYVATVVAHEISHQWFGNLVTMDWWTHLWLKEGFASFMQFLCVDHIFPEYDIWSQFVTDAYGLALQLDSLHNSHPIEVPVKHTSEIGQIFDAISYDKGAAVIRMLHSYIGDAHFRSGLKIYLDKFAYKSASTEDLWDCLSAASSKPVRAIMSNWTAQKGYPWLSIAYAKDGDNVKLSVSQSKFSANGKIQEDEVDMTWSIPISVAIGSNPAESKQIATLCTKSSDIIVSSVGDSWLKLNPGTIGLYRTAYPQEMIQKLLPAISNKTMLPMDRLGLQDDFYALCQAGKVSTVDLLKLLQEFKSEDVYTVWNSISNCLGRLSVLLSYTDFNNKFQAYGRELLREIFNKLTWCPHSNEKHTDGMTRSLVINRLVSLDDQDVIDRAKLLYEAHRNKTGALIAADLRSAVYRVVSAHGDDNSFESLFEEFQATKLQEEKDRIVAALGFSRGDARLKRVVDFALSDQVRDQDRRFFVESLGASNPLVAWKLFQDNKDTIRQKYENNLILLSGIIKSATGNFASEEMAQEIVTFFKENKFPGSERAVQQSLETVRLNAEWLARDREQMREYLAAY